MKRTLTAVFALCLLFLAACAPSAEERISRTLEAVELLNESSKLPIDMLEPTQSNAEYPDLRPQAKYKYDEQLEFIYRCYYNRYPNDAEKKSITSIHLFSDEYNVFGVEVGMDVDEAGELLKAYGLKKRKPIASSLMKHSTLTYYCEDLNVELETSPESGEIIKVFAYIDFRGK